MGDRITPDYIRWVLWNCRRIYAVDRAGEGPGRLYCYLYNTDVYKRQDVYYGAINENSKTKIYQPQLLKKFPNVFGKLWEGETDLSKIIEVYDVSEINARLILDAREGRAVCRLTEILEEPIPL